MIERRYPLVRHVVAAVAVLSIAGCAVGPNFQRPAAPKVASVAAGPLPSATVSAEVTGGQAQHFVSGGDIPAQWWTLFHSTALNALIEQSLAHNADLKAAQAALTVARESTKAGRGGYFPAIDGGFSANRQMQSQQVAPAPNYPVVPDEYLFSFFTPQLSISYAPDVFGLNRRTVESLKAQEQSVQFQTIATRITLSTNVVAAAVQQASLRAQVAATRDLIAINAKMVKLLRYQLDKGYAGRLDLAAQESQLAQLQATLPPLLTQLDQQNNLLAVLAGYMPSQAPKQSFDLASLNLPQQLPLSLPSVLVAQRPDVRQAEANMHAASAQIGVAIANRLPNITLSANTGSTAVAMSQVFKTGTGFWSIGADIAAPIFHGGSLLHQERAAKAAYVQASEQYRGTVLTAFQNVADTLSALQHDAEGLQAAASAEQAAKLTLDLSQRQYKNGYASYLSLLSAEQGYQQARIALVQAQASRYTDTAALFQSLGGGWWHEQGTHAAHNDSIHAAANRDSDEK
ncbi:efflux transporter outer membrane subunit [Rhodanobacter sp. AS-Z3]|uniref:efflux transporter outer membrane subunit n=1 Tax=Rhodanobacter sp. AS-Z3 TaxID=3031330 RepID=UPI00247A30D6|nr:efflux transporter outer membrane subunit [Rhodanobacter sp. AS-Z3]WEN16020.1 efflux transporter outer membrane subunit [Rhodanobacter sp. AS-Z3]